MNPVKKMAPGKLDALKAMMGAGGGAGEGSGGAQEPAGDVMGPEAGGAPESAPAGDQGGDMDAQMSGVLDQLEGASQTLEGISPDDEQDAQTLGEAKAHLDHAVKLMNSLAHQESAEGAQEPTEQGAGGEMNQKDEL